MVVRISASILSADFRKLEQEIKKGERMMEGFDGDDR